MGRREFAQTEQQEENDAAGMRRIPVELRDSILTNESEGATAPLGIVDGWQKLVPPPNPTHPFGENSCQLCPTLLHSGR